MAVTYPKKKTAAELSNAYYRQYNPTATPKPTGMWANGQPPTPQSDAQPYSYQSSNPPAPAFDPSKANFNQFNSSLPAASPVDNNKPPTPPMTNPLQNQYQTDAAAKSSQATSILGQYQANINKTPTPFTYDMNSIKNDPLYTSGLASLNQDAQTATNQSLVNLGRRGIGNSQSAVTSANAQQQNVVNQANQKLAPQVIAQKYQQYLDANTQQQQQNKDLLGLAGVYDNQATAGLNRFESERKYDYGVGLDKKAEAITAEKTAYDREQTAAKTAYDREQATLKTAEAKRKEHIDLADHLSKEYNVHVYPTDDPMESYAQVAGIPTAAAQKIAADAKQTDFDNAVKAALADNTITQTQASILNQARQTVISQQNANSSTQNANSSSANSANSAKSAEQSRLMDIWQKSGVAPAGIPGVQEGTPIYEKPTGNQMTVDPKTSTDNHGLLSQDINEAKDAAEANALIEANRNSLTDADYKDLKKRIIDQF